MGFAGLLQGLCCSGIRSTFIGCQDGHVFRNICLITLSIGAWCLNMCHAVPLTKSGAQLQSSEDKFALHNFKKRINRTHSETAQNTIRNFDFSGTISIPLIASHEIHIATNDHKYLTFITTHNVITASHVEFPWSSEHHCKTCCCDGCV